MTEFKTGDRVRVSVIATVKKAWAEGSSGMDAGLTVEILGDEVLLNNSAVREGEDDLTVEKVEPPVVVFQPGDTVRSKRGGLLYTLGKNGYLSHGGGGIWVPHWTKFTSELYEKVDIG